MPNTIVTIKYSNGSTREFVASDELEKSINEGEMFSVTTMHSDMGRSEEEAVSKMYAGNPITALGNMMMMKRSAEKMRSSKSNRIIKSILDVCIKFMTDEISSHQSGMSPVATNYIKELTLVDNSVKCPATKSPCVHYIYQPDPNGEVAIEHCTHNDNSNDKEGNCTSFLCPLCTESA